MWKKAKVKGTDLIIEVRKAVIHNLNHFMISKDSGQFYNDSELEIIDDDDNNNKNNQ